MPELWTNLIAAVIYAVLGITIFVLSFWLLDRLTPGSLWREIIDEHNTALAIMTAGLSIGLSIVIAAAIY